MADKQFTDPSIIQEIIQSSARLKYLVTQKYQVALEDILSIRVDGDNYKIDIHTTPETFRFKAKGTDQALVKDPNTGGMALVFDPALTQGIYEIVQDYAPNN